MVSSCEFKSAKDVFDRVGAILRVQNESSDAHRTLLEAVEKLASEIVSMQCPGLEGSYSGCPGSTPYDNLAVLRTKHGVLHKRLQVSTKLLVTATTLVDILSTEYMGLPASRINHKLLYNAREFVSRMEAGGEEEST